MTFVGVESICKTAGGTQYLKGLLTVHIAFIPAYLTATKSKLRILQSLETGAAKDSSLSVKCKLPWWQNCCCPVWWVGTDDMWSAEKKKENKQEPLGNVFENQSLNTLGELRNISWLFAEKQGTWFSSLFGVNQNNCYLIQWKWHKSEPSVIRGASWSRSIYFSYKKSLLFLMRHLLFCYFGWNWYLNELAASAPAPENLKIIDNRLGPHTLLPKGRIHSA